MLTNQVPPTQAAHPLPAVRESDQPADFIAQTAHRLAAILEGHYMAILLVGAAARGESTMGPTGALLSDLDFLVVLPQRHLLPALLAERRCRRLITAHGAPFAPTVSIGFGSAVPGFWRVATPLMWELRQAGRVLAGAAAVTQWPAIQHTDQIPAWEGIRLVANRICEVLTAWARVGRADLAGAGEELEYACVKLILACSESDLIAAGTYQPTYSRRWARHESRRDRFSAADHALISTAYRAKLCTGEVRLGTDTNRLLGAALRLAIATLRTFAIQTADDLQARAGTEHPAGPGRGSDLIFFVRQHLAGQPARIRRPIGAVYAEAYALALALLAGEGLPAGDGQLYQRARRLAARYKATPQLVGIVPRAGG